MTRKTKPFAAVMGILAIVISATAFAYRRESHFAEPASPAVQDLNYLDRRVSALEQKLYTIESNINQLQQQLNFAQRPGGTGTRDLESERLRLDLEAFRIRVGEMECGLVKLDERTLTAEARKAAARSTDPCRLNPNTPVTLPGRKY